jgi:hypothetical protein
VQAVAGFALEVTAVHPVIGFEVTALAHDARGFVQGLTQRLPHGRPMIIWVVAALRSISRCGRTTMVRWRLMALFMRLNWRAQSVVPGLATQFLAFFGKSLLQIASRHSGRRRSLFPTAASLQ